MTVGQYTVGSWQQKTELRFESSQVRCHDEKFLHGLDPTDQQQCAVTRGRWRLTAAPTGLDSTGTPDCAWVYTHRPTAVSLHFAPCCTARDLTNWHRQAVQFSSHLTHTSRLHLSLRLPSHIVTQSNFYALSAECRLNLYCHIHQATVTSRDFQRMPQHIRDPFKISEKWKTNPSTVCYANALLQVVHRCTEL